MQAIKNWKLYASDQKVEAVCKQSKSGGCMQAIKKWRLYASDQRLEVGKAFMMLCGTYINV